MVVMVIPSFCVIKLNYLGNYSVMAVNDHKILTLGKSKVKITTVIYLSIVL